jgi:hypothetical protein
LETGIKSGKYFKGRKEEEGERESGQGRRKGEEWSSRVGTGIKYGKYFKVKKSSAGRS